MLISRNDRAAETAFCRKFWSDAQTPNPITSLHQSHDFMVLACQARKDASPADGTLVAFNDAPSDGSTEARAHGTVDFGASVRELAAMMLLRYRFLEGIVVAFILLLCVMQWNLETYGALQLKSGRSWPTRRKSCCALQQLEMSRLGASAMKN